MEIVMSWLIPCLFMVIPILFITLIALELHKEKKELQIRRVLRDILVEKYSRKLRRKIWFSEYDDLVNEALLFSQDKKR